MAGGPMDTSQDHELTNWIHVDKFVAALRTDDEASEFSVDRTLAQECFVSN